MRADSTRMWQGVSLVVDEFTRAAHGEIIVHAILLSNFAGHEKGPVAQTADATRLDPWKNYTAR